MWITEATNSWMAQARELIWALREDMMHALTCPSCGLRDTATRSLLMVDSSPAEFINMWTEDKYGV